MGTRVAHSTPFWMLWQNRFSIKDFGELNYFLGIEVLPTVDGLLLTQHKYIRDLFTKAGMEGAKECVTPMCIPISSIT
ncbi:hypothetical protein Sjap_021170 [Stephania japonica]|uniref:Reverse transcriptase Ty1/copia-type domain-containing protein n=1 Tax=Stephania japonica TaxID=461633 RepID=A0AAP0F3A8_9MAGN